MSTDKHVAAATEQFNDFFGTLTTVPSEMRDGYITEVARSSRQAEVVTNLLQRLKVKQSELDAEKLKTPDASTHMPRSEHDAAVIKLNDEIRKLSLEITTITGKNTALTQDLAGKDTQITALTQDLANKDRIFAASQVEAQKLRQQLNTANSKLKDVELKLIGMEASTLGPVLSTPAKAVLLSGTKPFPVGNVVLNDVDASFPLLEKIGITFTSDEKDTMKMMGFKYLVENYICGTQGYDQPDLAYRKSMK